MSSQNRRWLGWALGLSIAGLGVSIYLWLGKLGNAPLICGPSGGCISVNASPYSEIFGIPVAALGALMYLCLAAIALYLLFSPKRSGKESPPGVAFAGFAIALSGALFSLYLTGIEAFVLRAYCIWCLVSWGIITTTAVLWARALLNKPGEACSKRRT